MNVTLEKHFDKFESMIAVFGEFDCNIRKLAETLGVNITVCDRGVLISGNEKSADAALRALEGLEQLAARQAVSSQQAEMIIDCAKRGEVPDVGTLLSAVAVTARGKTVRAKTFGQRQYVDAITHSDVVFGVGPAGTGKTYLAVALAVNALRSGDVDRIVLTRPAVEAGEKLGFLPGDLSDKVDPYLRPLYDALREFLGDDQFDRMLEKGIIEIAPLAYMRGRTLSNSFVILDEAQNTTREQMKMFLTRMGFNSKIVVTGDITQTDLPYGVVSGMRNAIEILSGIKGIEIVRLTNVDIVRNALVTKIVEAYSKYEKSLAVSREDNSNKKTESVGLGEKNE